MDRSRNDSRALSELRGTMAAAWLDEREPETLFLARGRARPLWLGLTRTDLFFASTRRALAILEAALRVRLELREVREGRLVRVVDGRVVRQRRFRPGRYSEAAPHSPVHSPHEAVSCLERLAALAA
jgi:asparagine synthetase B (glutamine-hydrolysing)